MKENTPDVKTIGKHISNALKEELDGVPTIAIFTTVQFEGNRTVTRNIEYYDIPQGVRQFPHNRTYRLSRWGILQGFGKKPAAFSKMEIMAADEFYCIFRVVKEVYKHS